VLLALAALWLHLAGRRWAAASAFGLAMLSKETVVFAPVIAVMLSRRPHERWAAAVRRAWPLFATLGLWLLVWIATSERRPAIGLEVQVALAGVPAAFLHLLHVALGVEWPSGDPGSAVRALPPVALLLALAGIAWVALRGDGAEAAGGGRPPKQVLLAGALWAVVGAAPVVAVAGIWSAYYYLFAMCGVALAAGALVARRPAWVALLPALVVGAASHNARSLPEFATRRDPWSTQSHLNRHYLARGMALAQRCLSDLKRARPTLPASSTLYFAGIPASVAFQAADGPLVRWAYRDSSLRSYYLSNFELEHVVRGPVFFFQNARDTLTEVTGPDSLRHIGLGLILGDTPGPAFEVLALGYQNDPQVELAYWAAWAAGARGDPAAMRAWLERAEVTLDTGPAPEIASVLAQVAAGDTAKAIEIMSASVRRHGLDAGAHSLMADLLLSTGDLTYGTIEALAARVLAPEEPSTWRRWGLAEAVQGANEPAERALDRYLALIGPVGVADLEVQSALRTIRRKLPGGDLARGELGRVSR
ncbi:MAG TPA: hypothetical protein VFE44_08435, partial [Thermoanaerobaculia bacterium]|nr:hypothetical protein [Thermoanaerobaculia bacterium]